MAPLRALTSPAFGQSLLLARRLYSSTSLRVLRDDPDVPGFKLGGIKAGLKPSGNHDLCLVLSERPCTAAAVFTTNKFCAAPVQLDREILTACGGENVRAVLINAGQANAVTGSEGLANARAQVAAVKKQLNLASPSEVLVMSTGVIGSQLDMVKMTAGIEKVCGAVESGPKGWHIASRTIMTTDTVPKTATLSAPVGTSTILFGGMAKGAGMIHPNMATLLGITCTTANISAPCLQESIRFAADRSFNSIDIDGDTSTNDTVMVLANASVGPRIDSTRAPEFLQFRDALTALMQDLAQQIIKDAEGATRFVTIIVKGAKSFLDARQVGQSVAQSMLTKCAIFGNDGNWGRILCAVGYSGIDIDPKKVSLRFHAGPSADGSLSGSVELVRAGEPVGGPPARKAVGLLLKNNTEVALEIELGVGSEGATVWTSDLSYEYVKINAEYTT
mmetsp:Transcript_19752/g.50155  ORF Transcript_19752/g.50155 Transcript_19752/m.50155 type:complete len:447 (+) Transcript_19752:56-1396(+)